MSTPTQPSRSLSAIDDAVAAAHLSRRDRDDTAIVVDNLRILERASGTTIAEVLDVVVRSIPAAAPANASSTLTVEQENALRAAGSFVDEMPPVAERGSTLAVQRIVELLDGSLTTGQVAELLGVTAGRIRQRVAARTLLSVKAGGTLRFPRFQFVDGAEVLGWDRVAPAFPPGAHPVVVASFMRTPHVDLDVSGDATAPSDWLVGGGDPQSVIDLITTAFLLHAS